MRRLLLSLILAASAASPAFAWGKTGHRVVGEVADHYLTDEAAARDLVRREFTAGILA